MKSFIKYALVASPLFLLMAFTYAPAKKADTELKWYDWNEGYAKAMKEQKIVLVDAYTDWCGWCKKMDRDTYTNADVIKKINEHFVPIKFNPEIQGVTYKVGDQSYTPQQLHHMLSRGESTGFPTTYYIFPKKMGIIIDPGYKKPADFIGILDMAIAESKK
jgi:thioredoxin-related protein